MVIFYLDRPFCYVWKKKCDIKTSERGVKTVLLQHDRKY